MPLKVLGTVHLLWYHKLHIVHWIELALVSPEHMAHGLRPVRDVVEGSFPEIDSLVFGTLIFIPQLSTALRHLWKISITSSLLSAVNARSLAYNNSRWSPLLHILVASSIALLKSNGHFAVP